MTASRPGLKPLLLVSTIALTAGAHAATTDIATVPLATSADSAVLPNLMFVLDDSGSMDWDFMPDWVDDRLCRSAGATSTSSGSFDLACDNSVHTAPQPPFRSSSFNGMYYNPATYYFPPVDASGASYPSQTSANTAGWTAVKNDGFNIQSTSTINLLTGFRDLEWCTDTTYSDCLRNGNYVLPGKVNSKNYTVLHLAFARGNGFMAVGTPDAPTTQARDWGPHYYTIVPGEYCTSDSLRDCQTTQSSTYNVPATLRWCNSDANARAATPAANGCQALKTSTYQYARYPTKFSSPGTPGTWYGGFVRTDILPNNTYPKAADRSDCAGSSVCTYDEEMTNFANWWAYYHTRMQSMKTAASMAFGGLSNQFRVGYMSINNNTGTDFFNPKKFELADKADWFLKLKSAKPQNSTPLRVALARIGQFYAGRLRTINNVATVDPMEYSCQKNFTILSTDGYWNEASTPKQMDLSTDIGNQDGGLSRPYLDGNSTPNTLADVAAYYYNTDLRASGGSYCTGSRGVDVCLNSERIPSQNMSTFTLGLGASGYMQYRQNYETATSGDYFGVKTGVAADPANGVCSWQASGSACNWPAPRGDDQTTIDDLWHAAVNGHGTYFSAKDAKTLYYGLSSALAAIESTPGAAAGATSSNPNVSAEDNFIFSSRFKSNEWTGDIQRQQIDLGSHPPGSILPTVDWSAQALLDGNSTRTIYTFDTADATTHLKRFEWASLSDAEKAYFGAAHMTSAGALSQFCAYGLTCLSSDAQTSASGEKLVDFLRGDRSKEGTFYRQRTHVLGDIVDSRTTYVKAPKFNYADSGYADFKAANIRRAGMVYAGANDGMLHAFDAETGNERWAYVPHVLLPKLYKLADKNYSSQHQFFVNGSPVIADIAISGAWHTVLVGGLGAGGRGYYALDVTDPASPKALWEFTDDDLGLTVGKPEVVKLKDGTWVVIFASGYNNVSPGDGHGYLYVLNAATGAVIRKIDTGAGSTTTPSGLAHIRAWADNAAIDNTAQRVYAGDNLGNVWRFDINNILGPSGYEAHPLATLRGDSGNVQPVTARPELGLANGHAMVYVGTGRYLGTSDLTDDSRQSIYAIKDKLDTSSYGSPRSSTNRFVQQTLTDGTCPAQSTFCTADRAIRTGTSRAVDLETDDGWYVDLPASRERASTDPQLVLGTLTFTTNAPDPTPCKAGGSSFINFFDYRSGAPISGTDGVVSLGKDYLIGDPEIFCTAGANCSAAVQPGTGAGLQQEKLPLNGLSASTRRTSWRELPTEE